MREKIVFLLNSSYPYYTGGRETWLNHVSNLLIEDYDVTIITEDHACKTNDASRWENDNRIKIIQVKSLISYSFTQKMLRSYIACLNHFISARSMGKAVDRDIDRNQITYIISMDTVFLPLAYRRLKKRNPNIKTIVSSRGPHAEIYGRYWPLMKYRFLNLEKKNFAIADRIWSNGYDTQRQIREKGYDSTVIFNGVDCTRIINNDIPVHEELAKCKGLRIVTIGTLADIKGYPTIIKALRIIKNMSPNLNIHFFAFGKGNPTKYMQMAREQGVDKQVHFLGENKDAPLYAKQADLLLAMGTREGGGMSMAALEMLATGVPVIANNVPCYEQLINETKNGFLTAEDDPQKLAENIIYVLGLSESCRKNIGHTAQQNSMKNDWSEVAKQVKMEIAKL